MAEQANAPLPSGFALEEYTIKRQLSLGGFSIVYLASDPDGKEVAIKEYLPNSLALRAKGESVEEIAGLAESMRDRATPIPFGPYLAVAGWIQLNFGPQILQAWQAWTALD